MAVDDVKRITIVGAGLMGHGIGLEFAVAGHTVIFHDLNEGALRKCVERVEVDLRQMAEWELMESSHIDPTLKRIQTTTDLEEAGSEADLVIEAVFEDLSLKQDVFRKLDAVCPERTILASNTSSLMPSVLAEGTGRPDRVLVTHYFYPPPLMPLVEIVRSESTAEEVVATVYELMKAVGKRPIIVQKEALGFIVNRLQTALAREALSLVDRGIATAQDVDIATWNSFGRRLAVVGPLQLWEFQDGWEQGLQIYKYITPDLEHSPDPPQVIADLAERGDLGPKTGKGLYEWDAKSEEAFSRKLKEALAAFLRADRKRTGVREGSWC
jgi:3-hydroxybutyryl-CoA dehydrogenase